MHTAGIGQTTALEDTTVAELAAVLAAKAVGAAWLDELTAGMSLDAFVLFSSASATWGSGLQPAYAAANAYLDGLAVNRRARGLPATSVAWGLWGGGGMGEGKGGTWLQRRGLRVMAPDLAVRALGQAVDHGEVLVTVADVDWPQFAPAYTLRRPSPLIADLPEVRQALAAAEPAENGEAALGAGTALARQLASVPQADQDRMLVNMIRAEAAAVLGHASPEAVGASRPFRDLGFDSLTAVDLRNRLNTATGLRLPATLVFDYPSPAVLARHLRALITQDSVTAPQPVLAELDKLESMLSTIATEDIESADITARLEAVISKWKEAREKMAGVAVAEKLESSTDDEVFDFIGKEFGIS
jgi:acyl carrier protein